MFEGLSASEHPATFALLAFPVVISAGVALFAGLRLPPRPVVSVMILSVAATCGYQLRTLLTAIALDEATALFWVRALFWCPALMAGSGLHFLALLNEVPWAHSRRLLAAVYGGALAILAAHYAGLIVLTVQPNPTLGFLAESTGPLDGFQRLYGAVCIVGVLGLAVRYFVEWREHPVRGAGARVLAGSLALSMFAAMVTLTRIVAVPVFELAVPVFHLGLLYTVARHDLLSFSIEQTARPVLDAMGEGLLIVDAEGAVLHANHHACETYGADLPHTNVLDTPLRDGVLQALAGQPQRGFGVQLCDVESLVSCVAVREHDRTRVAISLTDVRHLRAAERGLVAAREDAEFAREAAETANRAKSTFLANMSHELRTPLNAIIGYAELLSDEADEGDRTDLGRIVSSGRYLLRLLDDVLDLSKLDAGHMDIVAEVFDVDATLAEVLPAIEVLAHTRGNELERDVGKAGWVLADPIRVRQILLNLLSNATKFTEHGSVLVRTYTRGAMVAIEVVDSGIGMDADQVARLFNRFEQVHRQTHAEYGGTGLGLSLSRDLARLMGGDLEVTSDPGRGSTFTLVLPKGSSIAAGTRGRRQSVPPR